MAEFTLDASGFVRGVYAGRVISDSAAGYVWSDLSPFTQGFMKAGLEAFMTSVRERYQEIDASDRRGEEGEEELAVLAAILADPPGFDRIDPDTLARFMEDCAKLAPHFGRRLYANTAADGALFWKNREGPGCLMHFGHVFPPLRLFLSDEGKVMFEELRR